MFLFFSILKFIRLSFVWGYSDSVILENLTFQHLLKRNILNIPWKYESKFCNKVWDCWVYINFIKILSSPSLPYSISINHFSHSLVITHLFYLQNSCSSVNTNSVFFSLCISFCPNFFLFLLCPFINFLAFTTLQGLIILQS